MPGSRHLHLAQGYYWLAGQRPAACRLPYWWYHTLSDGLDTLALRTPRRPTLISGSPSCPHSPKAPPRNWAAPQP